MKNILQMIKLLLTKKKKKEIKMPLKVILNDFWLSFHSFTVSTASVTFCSLC